jgi:hypothetical protein
MCQRVSALEQLERPPIGLMVHMDSNLGITVGDPSVEKHGEVEESDRDEDGDGGA